MSALLAITREQREFAVALLEHVKDGSDGVEIRLRGSLEAELAPLVFWDGYPYLVPDDAPVAHCGLEGED